MDFVVARAGHPGSVDVSRSSRASSSPPRPPVSHLPIEAIPSTLLVVAPLLLGRTYSLSLASTRPRTPPTSFLHRAGATRRRSTRPPSAATSPLHRPACLVVGSYVASGLLVVVVVVVVIFDRVIGSSVCCSSSTTRPSQLHRSIDGASDVCTLPPDPLSLLAPQLHPRPQGTPPLWTSQHRPGLVVALLPPSIPLLPPLRRRRSPPTFTSIVCFRPTRYDLFVLGGLALWQRTSLSFRRSLPKDRLSSSIALRNAQQRSPWDESLGLCQQSYIAAAASATLQPLRPSGSSSPASAATATASAVQPR